MAALPLAAWVAASSALHMTLADFAALPAGAPARIVPVDAAALLLEEYGSRFPVPRPGVAYPPAEFFAHLSHTFTRFDSAALAARGGECDKGGCDKGGRVLGVLAGVLGVEPYVETVEGPPFEERGGRRTPSPRALAGAATMGAGDGRTRYVAWARLAELPPVYW